MDHKQLLLPNGLRVVHTPMPAMYSVTVSVFVGVGSRHEPAHLAGISHLIEHMLFKGTERRPSARAISDEIEDVGGILNASTEKELTSYWAKVGREDLRLAIDLLADMLRCSTMRASDLSREKRVVLEELNSIMDDGSDWVHVLVDEALWPGQPVGGEIAGTRESVSRLRRSDLLRYMSWHYGATNAVVSVAGGAPTEEVMRLVEECFGTWQAVDPPAPVPASIPEDGSRFRFQWKPAEQVNLCLTYPGVPRPSGDRWAVGLLTGILGGGPSSRLFVEVRERLGLAYDVQAYTSHLADSGSITISAGTEPARTTQLVDAILTQIDRLQRRRVLDAELRRAKRSFRGRLWLGLEDTNAVAGWYGAQVLQEVEVVEPEEAAELIDAVTADDLRRVAREYLRPERARLAAVGPVAHLGLESQLLGA